MDFLESLSPQQRLLRAHQSGVRRLASVRVPLFGLPVGWAGARRTGDNETQTGVTRDDHGVHGEWHESVELLHESGSSVLSVRSSDRPGPIDDVALRALLGGVGGVGGVGAFDVRALDVDLAGDRVAFAAAVAADDWVARWVGYRATVTLRGHRWPIASGLELVRVEDLTPYHDGRLRLLEQRSGLDLRDG